MKASKNKGRPVRLWARMADHADAQEGGPTALHTAAFNGDIKKIKKLLADGINVNIVDAKGWTLLHDAVIQGHTEIVKLLIAAGADVNAQDTQERYTPLHEAARMNFPEIKKLLLAAGADTMLKDRWGNIASEIERIYHAANTEKLNK